MMFKIFVTVLLIVTVLTALPANFTWSNYQGRNFLTSAQNQNNPHRCESGWAFATINALNVRLNSRLQATGSIYPTVALSAQILLECDNYDMGCLGGQPNQALRWILKNGITDSTCNSYKARGYTNGGNSCSAQSKCQICWAKNQCSTQQNAKVYQLADMGSVSGQTDIQNQIYNHGPVSCGISATDGLKAYTGGIFADKTGANNFNHYVSVYGWGANANGTDKYWLIQNSYGPTWGEEGSFKLLRGANNLGIQSLCYWAGFKDNWSQSQSNDKVQNKQEVSAVPIVLKNYLTPSHNHLTPNYCDASWAFAVVQTLADVEFIRSSNKTVRSFSAQALLNCGVGSCQKGGDPFEALVFIHKYGIPEEGCQNYKAETPSKQSCSAINNCASCGGNSIYKQNCTEVKNYKRWKISEYGTITGQTQMKMQLANHQAIICGVQSTKAFREYKSGVFSETTIAPKINHYVEIIGYGAEGGVNYWLGRNFWGTAWGTLGFFKIKMGSSNLGVQTKCYWAGILL